MFPQSHIHNTAQSAAHLRTFPAAESRQHASAYSLQLGIVFGHSPQAGRQLLAFANSLKPGRQHISYNPTVNRQGADIHRERDTHTHTHTHTHTYCHACACRTASQTCMWAPDAALIKCTEMLRKAVGICVAAKGICVWLPGACTLQHRALVTYS